ncbi:globin [Pseudoalteromonas gelatinilytica]|uniref:globin n=1 Tax=Pseudoalteromonas gelatinilytica TaxID=1703256 RepID=UPI0011C36462|nr:globin [Pseudoalteromonas profundi]
MLKPDFHQFTSAYHRSLCSHKLTMSVPEHESITKRSYILYCALNKVVSHLDDLLQVTPFIHYLANNLSFLNVSFEDIDILCDAFIETRKSYMHHINTQLQQAWLQAMRIFANIVKSYLFAYSNVVSFSAYCPARLSS